MIIIIIIKGQQCKAGRECLHPISPKTPAPQYQPIDRKKRNGKRVEDYSRDRAAAQEGYNELIWTHISGYSFGKSSLICESI